MKFENPFKKTNSLESFKNVFEKLKERTKLIIGVGLVSFLSFNNIEAQPLQPNTSNEGDLKDPLELTEKQKKLIEEQKRWLLDFYQSEKGRELLYKTYTISEHIAKMIADYKQKIKEGMNPTSLRLFDGYEDDPSIFFNEILSKNTDLSDKAERILTNRLKELRNALIVAGPSNEGASSGEGGVIVDPNFNTSQNGETVPLVALTVLSTKNNLITAEYQYLYRKSGGVAPEKILGYLNTLRFLANKKGYYDPSKEDIDLQTLIKILEEDEDIKNNWEIKALLKTSLYVEDILLFLNTFVSADGIHTPDFYEMNKLKQKLEGGVSDSSNLA